MNAQVFIIRDDITRARLVRRIQESALKDKNGRPLMVTVQRKQLRRTLPQNSLFHSWVHILAKHAGCTDEEMKRDLKNELLPKHERVNKLTGDIVMEPLGTSKLNTVTMSEFMTRVHALAVEHFDIVLPSPDDPQSFEAFEESRMAA